MKPKTERARPGRPVPLDAHTLAGGLLFLVLLAFEWRGYVRKHEGIYLLGSHRIADPELLAADLTWADDLPSTTFVFDHLLAPLWGPLDDFGIVTVGRLAVCALFAVSLTTLARALSLPFWSTLAGAFVWLAWQQSIFFCGKPLEGFQPKELAFPFNFFALAFAIRGRMVRAGVAAGIATAFHIIVGGWACLALFASMLLQRRLFSFRQLALFLLGTAPLILPLLAAVAFFHTGGTSAEERAQMDAIYVTFAQPHCCDPRFFMRSSEQRWLAAAVLPLAPLLAWFWPHARAARIVAGYLAAIALVCGLGMLAGALELHAFLKLYPAQLASGVPALFLFVFALAMFAQRPQRRPGRAVWILALVVCAWLLRDVGSLREEVAELPGRLLSLREQGERSRYGGSVSQSRQQVYEWIRRNTPRGSIFVTPYLPEFWIYAERAQVAAFRHPPHDRRLVEWKRRLEELNGGRPFERRGFPIADELDRHQPRLSVAELLRMRERYGATHYLTRGRRPELAQGLRFAAGRYSVYEIAALDGGGG